MPQMRRDPVTGGWVILSPERNIRPQYYTDGGENTLAPNDCPFCKGNESMTPPEVYCIRENNSHANQPGWNLRVVPNKYPALKVEGNLDKQGEGFYDKMNGIGAHEVVIETPEHNKGLADLSQHALTDIFLTFKHRILDLKQDFRLKYIQVFKNQGASAGATIPHPHAQIVALPVVPETIDKELKNAQHHYQIKGRCIYCDILHHESRERKRLLLENSDYMVIAPFASRFPFQLNIYPNHHDASFEATDDALFPPLAEIFKESLTAINRTLETPAYNLVLHNAPFDGNVKDYFHWHLELVPVISGTGGFELGTNSYINPTPPEEAIKILKDASGSSPRGRFL
jgi:UDPglucose--hexose-1-phosphate uridylyltransferase